ncbi:MAG: hypothetical protein JWM34_2133 [Ilumatobacteraceae bacterium]|nr:hypothetical protein [Ilumatobacteraceae bacterium]
MKGLRSSGLVVAGILGITGMVASIVTVADAAPVQPANDGTVDSTPWTQPSMPAFCSAAAMTAGNVAACLLDGPDGRPETRGWPTPPYPTPTDGTAVAWTDLAQGASGSRVTTLQNALVTAGYNVTPDGVFGPVTDTIVRRFQVDQDLPETGIVDQATAGALGILETGGGTFPPSGWTWIGWAYNGSPALAAWEAQLVSNPKPIGKVFAKQIRSLPDAEPLFEGFVRDIVAGGYAITDVGTYAFRCTSNSRKDCDGQTRDEMSNHAYGLALDLNTAANPEVTYRGVNGATACATPLKTDIPMWVVRAAERWGLYWGGYGWNGGCKTPSQSKTSVLRDVMHFEFRGTPAQAKAIAAFNASGSAPAGIIQTPTTPTTVPTPALPPTKTCLNIADAAGTVTNHCLAKGEVPAADTRIVIATGAPAGATAAVVNITLTGAVAAGYVTAEPCTAVTASSLTANGDRTSSNGNAAPGTTTANLSVVPIDASGNFCLYESQAMQTIVDVQGFFAPAAAASGGGNLLTTVPPQRIIDTRTQTFCTSGGTCGKPGPVAANTAIMVGTAAVPPNAVATLANLTVTGSNGSGYVTADACSSLVVGPQTRSNTNFSSGATVANLAVVPSEALSSSLATALGATTGSQLCTYTSATTQKVIDVQGYFAPAAGGGWGFATQPSQRLVDTRACSSDPTVSCPVSPAGSIVKVHGPAGASAVLVNLTLVGAKQAGYATADACSSLTAGPQTKSNSNMTVGAVAANVAVVPLDPDGSFCVYLSAATHLVVDLQGTFSPSAPLRFVPITPVRRHDTRELNTP